MSHNGGGNEASVTTQLQLGDVRLVEGGRVRTRQLDYELRRAEMTRALLTTQHAKIAAGEGGMGDNAAGVAGGGAFAARQRRHFSPFAAHGQRTPAAAFSKVSTDRYFAPRDKGEAHSTDAATKPPHPRRPARLGVAAYLKLKLSKISVKYIIIFAILVILNARRLYIIATDNPQLGGETSGNGPLEVKAARHTTTLLARPQEATLPQQRSGTTADRSEL